MIALKLTMQPVERDAEFDVNDLLDRKWLRSAMARWREEALVALSITTEQMERLKTDWYYQHATFELLAGGRALMTFGEDNPTVVMELLRWLGPGAELVAPTQWREIIRRQLAEMLSRYEDAV